MIEVLVTSEFEKRYVQLPLFVQKKAEKQEQIFRENPFHSSLHTEKLEPKGKQLWSIRIDLDYRIISRFLNAKQALFLTCGHHNQIYRYTF
ncbi:hypothetical protein COU05_01500 [bacterium (Candidatus Gribaldobacteria) CG10_big_fil_rev_8_21_14_0_10_37_21]|uniref:Type II toxin-antitoxin system mRNA interferase toxin, RelE/StbE family n=1 Tax=bacterium (Candidatus Gribaldobacteria) CG10_big_fil_rev_8_21_14_0_10_37_21 TaxID=2014275 RepID=A0A2H0UWI6_9BACT|nr:MAG: hypothetical protein AUJ25_01545 [Parcubacteria group bacterium CG1_02_37_13]PIR90549.1 MAG: hypothetical protein COU05_01500 [bacterium (Candidatus Gribaldobacteria) CG10_big_fil_rev_8_21_14_0_10_37_21]